MLVKRVFVGVTVTLIFMTVFLTNSEAAEKKIENGKKVTFDYVLSIDGQQLETSETTGPFEYIHGEGGIIKGLEKRIEGLKVGSEKTITVPSAEAYGPVRPNALREFPKSSFPENFEPKVGAIIQLQNQSGQKFPATIQEVKEDTVMLNLNHPLAGKDLQFDVKIVDIQ